MRISYDPLKRDKTLKERGLDFEDAAVVFGSVLIEVVDDRHDYGEIRVITAGMLGERMMIVCWTQRGDTRHVFSMRKANDREQKRYRQRLGQI